MKIDASLFAPMVDPYTGCDLYEWKQVFTPHVKRLLFRYIPRITSIPLYQGLTYDPTWKATPYSTGSCTLLSEGKSQWEATYGDLKPCRIPEVQVFSIT